MDYRTAKFYSITISPPIYRGDQTYIYNQHVYEIRKLLNKFSNYYMLVPEFSLDARLHYHGVILIKDFIKYGKLKHKLDREIGWTKIEKILSFKSHLRWLQYCKKDYRDNMFEIIKYKSLKKSNKKDYSRIQSYNLDSGLRLAKYGFI